MALNIASVKSAGNFALHQVKTLNQPLHSTLTPLIYKQLGIKRQISNKKFRTQNYDEHLLKHRLT